MIPVWIQDQVRWRENSSPVNRLGLASLVCGSLALLTTALGDLTLAAVAGSGLGLFLGALAMAAFLRKREGLVFPAAGLVVSLTALCLAVFGLSWDPDEETSEPRQKLIPVRNQMAANLGPGRSQAEPGNDLTWVDASKDAVQQGDVRVRVVSAGVKALELKESGGQKRRSEKCLVIKLRISNAGAGQLIQYSGWDQSVAVDPALLPIVHDSNGKTYALKVFDAGQEMVGHVSRWSIAPGKWVDEILAFEAVPAGVEFLRLELPCQAFQEEGTIRLQIPGRMIAVPAR